MKAVDMIGNVKKEKDMIDRNECREEKGGKEEEIQNQQRQKKNRAPRQRLAAVVFVRRSSSNSYYREFARPQPTRAGRRGVYDEASSGFQTQPT